MHKPKHPNAAQSGSAVLPLRAPPDHGAAISFRHFLRSINFYQSVNYLETRGDHFHLTLNMVFIATLAVCGILLISNPSFELFYLLPLTQAIWFLRLPLVFISSTMTGGAWLIENSFRTAGTIDAAMFAPASLASVALLVVIALLLGGLRQGYQHQKGLARTDHLTKASNSRAFHELTQAEIFRSRRYGHPFTLAYLDVDDFKLVNDTYGHNVGDKLLRFICDVIQSRLRQTDVFARLGGDEFAILLPETGSDAAKAAIEKVQTALIAQMKENGWTTTFSIGVVTCLEAPDSVEEAIKWADDLANQAKASGKNTVRYDVIRTEMVSVGSHIWNSARAGMRK